MGLRRHTQEVTRREALGLILGAPLAATACLRGPARGLPEGALLGTHQALGHRVCERAIGQLAPDKLQRVPVVIVGGGVAGLSAAWCLRRGGLVPGRDFVVLEMEGQAGGTARAGNHGAIAYPWGAHYLPAPQQDNYPLIALLREMGILTGVDKHGDPTVDELHLCHDPQERIFFAGRWHEGLFPHEGASDADIGQFKRFLQVVDGWVAWRDAYGRRAFALPVSACSDAPECQALDAVTAVQWMDAHGFDSPRLRWLVNYACRDDYGGTLEQVSAWAALFYFAARVPRPGAQAQPIITWPEGNQRLVRALSQGLAQAVVTETLATDIHPNGAGVVVYGLRENQAVGWQADRVIFAGPQYVARHVVRPLRDAPPVATPTFSAWMVANLALRVRPAERGFPLAWDNVLYQSPSVGYVVNSHQRDEHTGSTVFTYYYPLTQHDAPTTRHMLTDLTYAHWAEAIVADLRQAHPDLPGLVTRLDVWRWGHAMVRPGIGTFTNPQRKRAALPHRGIHWAHSDLSGMALFEEAFAHGVRAAEEVLVARDMPLPSWS